jgi:hypothetical protein
MLAITAESQVKDFMTIQKSKKRVRVFFQFLVNMVVGALLIGNFNSCSPDLSDDPIPFVPFSAITINLTLPQYIALKSDRGSLTIEGGVRGIILYRENATTYRAFEKNCSYQPNNACGTVEIHASTLFMSDPCCNSTFEFETGNPTAGPAWRPLRQYETLLTGSSLTITDTIVE